MENLTLNIEQVNNFEFNVMSTDNSINANVFYFNNYSHNNSIKGKGSRKYKDYIIEQIKLFKEEKRQKEIEQQENELKEKRQQLKETEEYKNINLLQLYEVVQMKQDYETGKYDKINSLLTGIEVQDDYNNVIDFTTHNINNTDIYCIGNDSHYERRAKIDHSIFIIGIAKHAYVTGLKLKEMLYNGLQSYGNIRLAQYNEIDMIMNYGKENSNSRVRLLTDFTTDIHKKEMAEKINNELERTKMSKFTLPEARKTNEGKEIRKAFFSCKPINFDELRNKENASYDDYIISDSIVLDKDAFILFARSLDMKLLKLDYSFKGGTDSTYKLKNESLWECDEIEQLKFWEESYRIVLEVKCSELDYSILIDPQGYDYVRYASIVEK